MNIAFYILSAVFVVLMVFGVPLLVVQYRTATKKLRELETKRTLFPYNNVEQNK